MLERGEQEATGFLKEKKNSPIRISLFVVCMSFEAD
jgi:hypothetical protein